jgi:hypothetical protein
VNKDDSGGRAQVGDGSTVATRRLTCAHGRDAEHWHDARPDQSSTRPHCACGPAR